MDLFPNAVVSNLNFYGSKHCPVKVQLKGRNTHVAQPLRRLFPFENKWLLEVDYLETIEKTWAPICYNPDLVSRLHSISSELKRWAECTSGSLE